MKVVRSTDPKNQIQLDTERAGLLTPEALAKALGVSRAWVINQARYGDLPCVRLSQRVIRFDPRAVDAWVQTLSAPGGYRVP